MYFYFSGLRRRSLEFTSPKSILFLLAWLFFLNMAFNAYLDVLDVNSWEQDVLPTDEAVFFSSQLDAVASAFVLCVLVVGGLLVELVYGPLDCIPPEMNE
ncbi:MAG: hypothetical protein P1Q69_11770 [Candidatus Thorarchaeota archaeon]|nr:hypothetical protein [Candidatus Thorarchaeota archaeon]